MKHLLVFAVALLTCAGLWAVLRNGPVKRLSVSLHVARERVTRVVFGTATLGAAVLMGLNFFGWLLPRYEANLLSYGMFGLVVVCFVIIALIPHIEGTWREPVHNLAAWGVVDLVPLVILLTLFWPLALFAFWSGITVLILVCVLLLLALFRKDLRRWFLYFQIAYLMLFFMFLLLITYY